jgi:hypothetical protein
VGRRRIYADDAARKRAHRQRVADKVAALEVQIAAAARPPVRFDNGLRRRSSAHARQRLLTPAYILDPVRALFGGRIGLDPCTEADNPTGALLFYAPPVDGCALPWEAETVFVNPPYGQARERWVERCVHEGQRRKVVLLIPAATETRIVQKALSTCTGVVFIKARLMFETVRPNRRHEAASHGSALFGFGVDLEPVAHLGVLLRSGLAAYAAGTPLHELSPHIAETEVAALP